MGLYNYERIAERLLKKLESLPEGSEEYKRTLYAYNKVTNKQPTFSHKEEVADYLKLKMMSDPNLELVPGLNESISYFQEHGNVPSMVPSHGGPASGGESVPPSIDRAEAVGQTVSDTGASPYQEAKRSDGFSNTSFGELARKYVADAELAEREEADRVANSVKIDIPGGNEGLQRIRQQAGGTPGGGTFSVGGGVTGGDTEEDMRAYVDRYRNTEVDRQIGLIEQAFPAANRPPALDARLQTLYEARANRDQQETARQRLPIDAYNADTERLAAEGLSEYHRNYGPTQIEVARLGVEESTNRLTEQQRSSMRNDLDQLLTGLEKDAKTDASLRPLLNEVRRVAFDPRIPLEEKNRLISEMFGNPEGDINQKLSAADAKLFNIP